MYLLIVFLTYLALLLPYNYIIADQYIEWYMYCFAAIVEISLIILIYLCIKHVKSLPYIRKKRKKQRKREERRRINEELRDAWRAREPERKREREREKAKRREEERKRTTIVATYLIAKGKKDTGRIVRRGIFGAILGGSAGSTLGAMTAYHKNSKICTFLIKYLDGHTAKIEVTEGSLLYKECMKYIKRDE